MNPLPGVAEQTRDLEQELPVVLSVAFPYAPIGPCAVGGSEVILSEMEAAMPSLGFRSVVVAHADSQPRGHLYPTRVPKGEITDAMRAEVEPAHQANIDRAFAENPVALVHMHGLDFHRYRVPEGVPVLVTLHLPPSWYPETIWSLPANFHLLCVSETERQACPSGTQSRITVVENGVALPEASSLRTSGRYALMLSRVCPEKNLHTGLDAARMAGLPAMLAGEIFPYEAHQRYFAEQMKPRLSAFEHVHEARDHRTSAQPEARFLGPVTGAAKARLLSRAACLLIPSLAPETSSLATMEALAFGVPVIAVASGALPEIVEHGRTGFLIDPSKDIARGMAEAIQRVPEIDRHVCRTAAEQRFNRDRMLNDYCRLYRAHALSPSRTSCSFTYSPRNSAATNGTSPGHVSVTTLTTPEDLYALRDDWVGLWQKDRRATPFQHPAWLLPWWTQFGPDGRLRTVTLRGEGGHLLGLLPLYVYPDGNTGERKLLLVGASTSDYLDGLFDPEVTLAQLTGLALPSVLDLASDQPCWDTLTLLQLREDSPLLPAAAAEPSGTLSQIAADPCFRISTAASLPPKVRANARRYQRRAEAGGPLKFDLASTAEEALSSFEELAELHRARWQLRGEPGVLADERVLSQHREAIPQLLTAGLLRIFCLTRNGDALGVLYALADAPQRAERTLYLYLVGINPDFAELSPGTLLLHSVWEYAQKEGFLYLDFLRGGEGYKHLWGATPRPTFGIYATSKRF